ncbi:MAG: DUF5320 domain-containing protein [Bacteroidales bacterium]|nr:DUF5320 domain-containing protein [Bacteroidales bacterium]
MPGLNKKGPIGDGPMTGRRMGRCNPENRGKTDEEIMQSRDVESPGQGQIFGHGLGRGRGRGFGRGLGRGRFSGNV